MTRPLAAILLLCSVAYAGEKQIRVIGTTDDGWLRIEERAVPTPDPDPIPDPVPPTGE